MIFSLSPFAPENLASRDGFGRPVPREPVHSLHLSLVLTHTLPSFLLIPPTFRLGVHLYSQPPSGESRVYRITQWVPMVLTIKSPPAQGPALPQRTTSCTSRVSCTHCPEDYWPCGGGLSVVNAIGTQLRDVRNSGLARWRLTV